MKPLRLLVLCALLLPLPVHAQLFFKDSDKDGIRDKNDRCPFTSEDKNGIADDDGCPDDADNDGIADASDRCPRTQEDMNGYEDDDGCPDDTDGDGIPNVADRCPLRKGDGEDGCTESTPKAQQTQATQPESYGLAMARMPAWATDSPMLTVSGVLIPSRIEPILFKNGKDSLGALPDAQTPRPESRCEQLLRVLLARPELQVYLVGHASEEGKPDANVALSQKRADNVRTYLLSHGIAPERILDTLGKGTAEPIDRGTSSAAQRLNRRVEVFLVPVGQSLPTPPSQTARREEESKPMEATPTAQIVGETSP